MKIRTLSDLQGKLDEEYSWRIQEISNYSIELKTTRSLAKKSLIRAGIPLLYAHWEGFIKETTIFYIEYVENQRIPLNKLDKSLIALGVRKYIHELVKSKNDNINGKTIEFILETLSKRASLSFEESIMTESNLSSKVFKRIISSIGLEYASYSTKEKLIDERLLNTRNKIAHGEYKDIKQEDFEYIKDEIIDIMRAYKNDLEDYSMQKKYLKKIA